MQKAPPADDRPVVVIWEVTRRCQAACRRCRSEKDSRPHPEELDRDQWLALIDHLAEITPRDLVLTGCDPAAHPDILEIIDHATMLGLRVTFNPDATPQLLQLNFDDLRRAGVRRMSLRLDGTSESTHDARRGTHGTWDRTMRAISAARQARIPVEIVTTISRSNIAEFPGFVSLVERLQPVRWSVSPLVPAGHTSTSEMLDATETEELLDTLTKIPARTGLPVNTIEAPQFRRVILQSLPHVGFGSQPQWRSAPVNAGKGCVFVSHTGDVRPGELLPLNCGNVRDTPLIDIYRNSEIFRTLRDPDALRGKCGRCEYREICGGSRARAFAVTGDHLASEPTCPHQPKSRAIIFV